MSDEQHRPSLASQVLVPVIVALLVGGTSPWWWNQLFPKKPQNGGGAPQETPHQGSGTDVASNGGSRTNFSLAGDEVVFFRVAERNGRLLTVDVDYRYNDQHGDKVMVGAWLTGVSSGYKPVFVPAPGQGTAQVELTVNEPGTSTGIDIFLYEYGKPAETFARRVFPYQATFE